MTEASAHLHFAIGDHNHPLHLHTNPFQVVEYIGLFVFASRRLSPFPLSLSLAASCGVV